LKIPKV